MGRGRGGHLSAERSITDDDSPRGLRQSLRVLGECCQGAALCGCRGRGSNHHNQREQACSHGPPLADGTRRSYAETEPELVVDRQRRPSGRFTEYVLSQSDIWSWSIRTYLESNAVRTKAETPSAIFRFRA